MKGSYHFRVKSKKTLFKFTIRRNITVIKGDSATGKRRCCTCFTSICAWDYVECERFESWEQFFADLLEWLTEGTGHKYSKMHLDAYYLRKNNVQMVLALFPEEIICQDML